MEEPVNGTNEPDENGVEDEDGDDDDVGDDEVSTSKQGMTSDRMKWKAVFHLNCIINFCSRYEKIQKICVLLPQILFLNCIIVSMPFRYVVFWPMLILRARILLMVSP